MPTATKRWSVEPASGDGPPYYAVDPDGTKHGQYEKNEDAWVRVHQENAKISDAELHEHALETLPVLLSLKRRGATSVSLQYDGCGDEGRLEPVVVDGAPATSEECRLLEDYFEYALEHRHAGWENNEGSNGEFTVELTVDPIKIEHSHNWPVESYETDTLIDELVGSGSTSVGSSGPGEDMQGGDRGALGGD